jgi:hypothetical protein
MTGESSIILIINFSDLNLNTDERDGEAQRLLDELRDMDEVQSVKRVDDPNPPEGNKAVGAWLAGILMAEVNPANAKAVFGYLGDRLGGKPIELEVEANGKKLKVKAHSREELTAAIEAAQKFVAA